MAAYPAEFSARPPRPEVRLIVPTSAYGAEDVCREDVVYYSLRPLWFAMQAVGFHPYHLSCRGVRGRQPSLGLVVHILQCAGVMVLMVMALLALKSSVASSNEVVDFDGAIINYLMYIQCALPLALLPLYTLRRAPVIRYLHDWNKFQVEYGRESGRRLLVSPSAAYQAVTVVLLWLLLVSAVQAALQPLPTIVIAALGYFNLVSAMLTVLWLLHGRLLRLAARDLANHFSKVLAPRNPAPEAVEAVRRLLVRLLSLSEHLGSSLSLPLGLLLLVHFILQTLTLYAVFGQLTDPQSPPVTLNERLPCLATGVLTSGLVLYACCDSGHRVAVTVKSSVLQQLFAFRKRTLVISKDLYPMMEAFISTANELPGAVTLSGITTVNRQLFTAILSTMVTYLVVVVQFRISLVTMKGPLPTGLVSNSTLLGDTSPPTTVFLIGIKTNDE